MAQREGLASFYKGFWPNFLRVGSFNVVMWLSYEWFKDAFKQLTIHPRERRLGGQSYT